MSVEKVLYFLSDGEFHSGETIANQLNVSRTAVWKYIEKLKDLGADIYSVKGKGYRIPGGLDLIRVERLYERIKHLVKKENLHFFTSIASTNQFLLSKADIDDLQVCSAEFQSLGRGRLGRVWHSPFAKNIYLSVRRTLPIPADRLSGFSLAIGCAIASCFDSMGAHGIRLKWPNDLRIEGRKVGGILVELASHNHCSTDIVVGIGINWNMPDSQPIAQSWCNLAPFCEHGLMREKVIADLLEAITNAMVQFSENGFEVFNESWKQYDEFMDKPVKLIAGKTVVEGIYRGIDDEGAVLIQRDNKLERYNGGELSLRELK